LRKLALETIDLAKDPYFMKNHLGSYECKLCLTLHNNEGSYLAHTQGKKHQTNLARRAAKEAKETMGTVSLQTLKSFQNVPVVRNVVKIGRPGYKVTKIRDPVTRQLGLLFQVQYPEIVGNVVPRHRFMSAFEQRVDVPNKNYQYLLVAAEPYETIAFKLQRREIDKNEGRLFHHWDKEGKQFSLQFFFRNDKMGGHPPSMMPPMMPPGMMGMPPGIQPGFPMQG
jgi:splicing factor 3A subunit 2